MKIDDLIALAKEVGFTHCVPLNPDTIELKSEVRDMCAVNTCGQYGKSWSCPPGCGTLEECGQRLNGYTSGVLVQTVGDIEDGFDFEAIAEIAEEHGARFQKMYAALREKSDQSILAIGTGSCTTCKTCTYPDEPCRFPEKMVSSMEAYGMLVLEVCKANNLQYYYGSDKMAYTGCFLL